jgi:prepilin-type N-terminal cleavage/methylation domain-containing protein
MRPGEARPRQRDGEPAESGFTLIEMLVVMLVTVILVLVLLQLFDGMSRMARVQTHLVDLQQQQRVAQRELASVLRMVGRGGLTGEPVTAAGSDRSVRRLTALEVRNNVGQGGNPPAEPVIGGSATAIVGSDVLIVRGVFSTPVYQVNYVDPDAYVQGVNRVELTDTTPTGVPQDLEPLRQAIAAARAEALIFTDALGDAYGVAELVPSLSSSTADTVTLTFRTTGSANADLFSALSTGGSFPDFRKVLTVGILEEYRYYVTEGPVGRQLDCARVYPGTEAVHDLGSIDRLVARDIFDLQLALGFDSHQGGGFLTCDDDVAGSDDEIVEVAGGAADDWLFNGAGVSATGEDADQAPWTEPSGGWATSRNCGDAVQPRLYYVRLSTLALSPRPDPYHEADPLASLEDRVYGSAADDPLNGTTARRFRRRILQTTIDLRNL